MESYKNTDSQERCYIIRNIIETVREAGGRFLKFDKNDQQWYDAGSNEAHRKIRRAFREASIQDKVKCIEAMKILMKQEENSIERLPLSQMLQNLVPLHHISRSYLDPLPLHHEDKYYPYDDDLEPISIFCHQPDDMDLNVGSHDENNQSSPWMYWSASSWSKLPLLQHLCAAAKRYIYLFPCSKTTTSLRVT